MLALVSACEKEVIVATAVFNRQVLSLTSMLCDRGWTRAVSEAVEFVLTVFPVACVSEVAG